MVMTEAWEGLQHDRNAVEAVIAALAAMVGNRLVTSQAVREQHANTVTWLGNQPPDAVVFPHTTEEVLWGGDLVFKIGGKMYAVTVLEPGPLCLSFKCTPETFAELTERPGIIPAPYSARYHWVALKARTRCRLPRSSG